MDEETSLATREFKGLKNDESAKNIPFDYFYNIKNWDYPDTGVLGMSKILMPHRVVQLSSSAVDEVFEYRFLDSNNVLQIQWIGISGGTISRLPNLTGGSPITLKTGLTPGRCSAVTYNDELYIANGKNYVQKYNGQLGLITEMGAPYAVASTSSGNLTGTYSYKISYVQTGSVEEFIGGVSNTVTVSLKQINLTLPLGYTGTVSRNIYRTKGTDPTKWYKVASIADNTTTTYTDTFSDNLLTSQYPTTLNNEMPKPYHLRVTQQKLYGAKVDLYPTQIFGTDTNKTIFDTGSGIDISNYGSDNTPIQGIGIDFNKLLIGSQKNIVLYDPATGTVTFTRANIGILDGYSVQTVPTFGEFPGGLFFVSSQKDVRVMMGLQALPVATSLDNVHTGNWSQNIRGTLMADLNSYSNIASTFFNYKYYLAIDDKKYVFDIRTQGWTYHNIQTASYQSSPRVLSILNGYLFNGQPDGWIEQEYQDIQYRGEEVPALLESPDILVSDNWNMIETFLLWLTPTSKNICDVTITLNNNTDYQIKASFTLYGGAFDPMYFDSATFDTSGLDQDYRVVNIWRNARWFKWKLEVNTGNTSLQGVGIKAQIQENKERPV